MRIAVIPARGGSKRIPRKNFRDFDGEPMMTYPIREAKNSGIFDRIIVSTDDPQISSIAKENGAEVPFMRPVDLSDDHTPTAPVISHAVQWCLERGLKVDYVCCIYATSPFLRREDLLEGFNRIKQEGWDFVISITSFPFPVQRAIRIRKNGGLQMIDEKKYMVRSQDLEECYHDAGQFYWGTSQAWIEQKPIFSNRSGFVELPRWRVQDIDNEEDWRRAEVIKRVSDEIGLEHT